MPYFSNFWDKKSFTKKYSSVTHNFIRVSSTMLKSRKTKSSNSKKISRETEGQKYGQTLCYWTLLATARGPTSTTAVDWHLKIKDTEYDVGLTKSYCITVITEKISSFYELTTDFRVSWIKWPHPIIEITFTFPVWTSMQKISSLHLFILEFQSILESHGQTDHTHLNIFDQF